MEVGLIWIRSADFGSPWRRYALFQCCCLTVSGATREWLIDWVRLNVPPNTLWVISGTGFYGSNDPTNSVKALKKDTSKGLGFNPIRSTPPCSQWYNNYAIWHNNTQNTQRGAQINKSTHSEIDPVRQNPSQRTVRTAHLCVLMTVHSFSTPEWI